ncbi:MAG: hypothetical protein LBI42_08650 [Chitinispirillales bacterium]|jgi:hypothetical protein|nr:hypothetical protein [Chitinispirillales bacterium]
MKTIDSQKQLYTELARCGDPAAFCALFRDHLNNVYISLRAGDKEHGKAADMAVEKVLRVYQKFTGKRLRNPQRWVVSKCGLKNFDAGNAVGIDAAASLGDYEKRLNTALQRCYGEWLNDNGSKRKIKNRKPPFILALWLLVAAGVLSFLFFSGSVFFISFERFDKELKISFPMIKEELWKRSGLVHSAIETDHMTTPPQKINIDIVPEPVGSDE